MHSSIKSIGRKQTQTPDESGTSRSPVKGATTSEPALQEAGNQAVQTLFQAGLIQPKLENKSSALSELESPIQAKLTVGAPNDKYEREADQVAETVMRLPDTNVTKPFEEEEEELSGESQIVQTKSIAPLYVQHVCTECEEELQQDNSSSVSPPPIQPKSNGEFSLPITHRVAKTIQSPSGGSPLPQHIQSRVSGFLGNDLSHVKVHNDSKANEPAQSINEKAFTHQNDIYLVAQKQKPNQQTKADNFKTHVRKSFVQNQEVRSILNLQRTIGNQAVQRLLQIHAEEVNSRLTGTASRHFGHDFSRIPIYPPTGVAMHTKLATNTPGDEYEQDADHVADQVMRMPESRASSSDLPYSFHSATEIERDNMLIPPKQTSNSGRTLSAYSQTAISSLTGGTRLPKSERAFFEPRFGRSFENVRIRSGADADIAARSINARAFTLRNDIAFAQGQYRPGTEDGRHLLAHELTHTLQQDQQQSPQIQRWVAPTDWLDYIGLGIDFAERIYIELAYEEGQEKDFQRFVNTLFFAIDLVLAALPGAGGGGLTVRVSHEAAELAWDLVPASAKIAVAERVAKTMGWSLAKATQMINMYFRKSKASGEKTTEKKGPKGPSGKKSTEKYLRKRWDKGTFETTEKSIKYHLDRHGRGLSAVEYTQRAEKAFKDPKAVGYSVADIQGRPAVRIVSEKFGTGLFTPQGKIIWFHPR